MPYTLAKMLVWIVLAVGLGVITGWMLRNVTARRQVARARTQRGDNGGHGEVERLRGRITTLESAIAERDRRIATLESEPAEAEPEPVVEAVLEPVPDSASTPADPAMAGAEVALGRPVAVDDLTVIAGIGPKVADLCHGIGIRTWSDLATTEVSLLQTMLTDAGARFKTHDPSTWPRQAELLSRGDWDGFRALSDDLAAPSDASTS